MLQTIVFACLATTVQGLVRRRWSRPERMVGDLSVATLLLSMAFAVGVAADVIGFSFTRIYGGRFEGLYDNPNTLGMTAALVLPTAWGLWRHTKKSLYLLAMVPTGASILMSSTRTAAVAVAVGVLWVLLRKGALSVLLTAVGAAFAAVLVYLIAAVTSLEIPPAVASLLNRFTADQGGSLLNARMEAWSDAIALWRARPLEGWGYSAGPALFNSLRNSGMVTFTSDVVHDSYLQWLMELGLIGVVPLLVLLVTCAVAVFRCRLSSYGSGLVCTVVAGLLIQVTESAMFGTGQAYPFLFWIAVAAAVGSRQPPPADSPRLVLKAQSNSIGASR